MLLGPSRLVACVCPATLGCTTNKEKGRRYLMALDFKQQRRGKGDGGTNYEVRRGKARDARCICNTKYLDKLEGTRVETCTQDKRSWIKYIAIRGHKSKARVQCRGRQAPAQSKTNPVATETPMPHVCTNSHPLKTPPPHHQSPQCQCFRAQDEAGLHTTRHGKTPASREAPGGLRWPPLACTSTYRCAQNEKERPTTTIAEVKGCTAS